MSGYVDQFTVILIEDNDADAELIEGFLQPKTHLKYHVHRFRRLRDAEEFLRSGNTGVIVILDLGLPDSSGLYAIERIQKCLPSVAAVSVVPIIVLTGSSENNARGFEAIRLGAQDFLLKGEVSQSLLERSIRYAVERSRLLVELESKKTVEIHALTTALAKDSIMTEWQDTSVTAKLSGVGPLRDRDPDFFAAIQSKYESLLDEYLETIGFGRPPPRTKINNLAGDIASQWGSARDVIDLHVKAVKEKTKGVSTQRVAAFSIEGRLLAVELMGYLVDYYRMGTIMKLELPTTKKDESVKGKE
jgi:DNA-binding response OmpR family regulator